MYISVDPLDLKKNSRSVSFYYKDVNAFINAKRVFLEISYHCINDDGTPLTQSQNISCLNPPSHGLIEDVTLNIGK